MSRVPQTKPIIIKTSSSNDSHGLTTSRPNDSHGPTFSRPNDSHGLTTSRPNDSHGPTHQTPVTPSTPDLFSETATVEEAAKRISVCRATIYKLIGAKKLSAKRIGRGYRISWRSINEYIKV